MVSDRRKLVFKCPSGPWLALCRCGYRHSLTHSIAQTITELCDLDGYADDSVSYAPRWAPPYSDGPCVEGYESWVARDGLMPASTWRAYARALYDANQARRDTCLRHRPAPLPYPTTY